MLNEKNMQFSSYLWPIIAKISASYRKSGSGNTMVMSDYWPEVKIWPFRACAMKHLQFGSYLWPNRQNSWIIQEIGVGEHDGDVGFLTGSRNMAGSRMRNKNMQFGSYLWPNRQNSFILYEIGVGEHDGNVVYWPEVEIWLFCAYLRRNMQFGPYLWPNR